MPFLPKKRRKELSPKERKNRVMQEKEKRSENQTWPKLGGSQGKGKRIN